MKAEERKELQTNSLVRFFGRIKDNFKGTPSRRATVIWGIILLALVVFIAWKFIANANARRNSERWTKLNTATDADQLKELIAQNKGTMAAHAARLQVARGELEDGLTALYTDPSLAKEKLDSAAESFEDLAKQFKAVPVLVQDCLFSAGLAQEGLGNFDRARELYDDLRGRFKDSPLAARAAELAKEIEGNGGELRAFQAEIKRRAEAPPEPVKKDDKKDDKKK